MELSQRGCCPSPAEVVARLVGDDVPQAAPEMRLRERLVAAERIAEEARCTELLGAANCDEVKRWLDYLGGLERILLDLTSPNRGLFDNQPLKIRAEAVRSHCQHSPVAAKAAADLVEALAYLNDHLEAHGPFLLCGSFSLADVCGVCTFIDAFRLALPAGIRSRYQAVLRWLELSLEEEAFEGFGGVEGIQFCSWPASEEQGFEERVAQVSSESKHSTALPTAPLKESLTLNPPSSAVEKTSPPLDGVASRSSATKNTEVHAESQRPSEHAELQKPRDPAPSPSKQSRDNANNGNNTLRVAEPVVEIADEKERLRAKHQLMMQQALGPSSSNSTSNLESGTSITANEERVDTSSASSNIRSRACQWGASSLSRCFSPQLCICALVFFVMGLRAKARRLWSTPVFLKSAAQHINQREILASVVLLAALAERFQLIGYLRSVYRRRTKSLRMSRGDPLADWDPWSAAANQSHRSTASAEVPLGSASAGTQEFSPSSSPAFKSNHFEGTREEFLQAHICYRLHGQTVLLSDASLFELGKRHFNDQLSFLESLDSGSVVVEEPAEPVFVAGGKDKPLDLSRPRYTEEDEYEPPPSWWEGNPELFFDVQMTAEADLASSSSPSFQWWDPEKIVESEHFVAVSKPSGMYVSGDKRGLWDANYMNFVHIVHQRFGMDCSLELNRRGVCNSLDIQVSGAQIFAKTSDAVNHYTKENSSHRVQKEYIALVEGRLDDGEMVGQGLIDVPLKKWQDYDRREFGSVVCASEGLPTVTKYRALRQWLVPAQGNMRFWGKDRWFTLVQIRVLAGRTLQIRSHMAFIGHPVIGDSKHNVRHYEQDCSVAPRIFLHCIRMEFEDIDGTRFVAASDLAPDLQGAIKRIERLSSPAEQIGPGRLPGLHRILQDTIGSRVDFPDAEGQSAEAFPRRFLTQTCLNCRGVSQAQCKKIQRGTQVAMLWTLKSLDSPAEDEQDETEGEKLQQDSIEPNKNQVKGTENDIEDNHHVAVKDASEPAKAQADSELEWGPGALWVPTLLQLQQRDMEAGRELLKEAATPEQLGRYWGQFGVDWCWSQEGVKRTGWIRLCSKGSLATKWGPGTWELLERPHGGAPLLLATFSGIEHALRLAEINDDDVAIQHFDVVSIRMLKAGQRSLKTDDANSSRALQEDAPSIGPTRGWPSKL